MQKVCETINWVLPFKEMILFIEMLLDIDFHLYYICMVLSVTGKVENSTAKTMLITFYWLCNWANF